MRQKLNENQAAQVGLVAVLVLVAIVFFLKSSGGEEEEPAAAPTVATVNGSTATGATPGEAIETAISGLEEPAAGATSEIPSTLPTPPPPPEFTSAYDSGATVVLLVADDAGIDRLTAQAAEVVEGMSETTLITVPVKQLPRYAGITLGLAVNRVPALVVVRPKRLSGGVPQATVDYGFQTRQSVVQAVRDASYAGPEASYYPD